MKTFLTYFTLIVIDLCMLFFLYMATLNPFVVICLWGLLTLSWLIFMDISKYFEKIGDKANNIVLSSKNIEDIVDLFKYNAFYNKIYTPLIFITVGFFFSIQSGLFLRTFTVPHIIALEVAWGSYILLILLVGVLCWKGFKTATRLRGTYE